tara:strand:- start:145047 stop:146441 length:1395 start_codon:yes stop_codon:yes gene_type:complete
MKQFILTLLALTMLISCGEEVLTQNTLSTSFKATDLEAFEYTTCAASRFTKPPVDILFVVDNSGSTLQSSFQQIKSQIASTVSTISNEFDYHVYIAPLNSTTTSSSEINNYPLLASDPSSVSGLNLVNIDQISASTFFSQASGGSQETGFSRAYNVINANRNNGIFRSNANTIVVMISNGDDTEAVTNIGGNKVFDQNKFNQLKQNFINLSNSMSTDSFRFISLVPHSNCNGWSTLGNYRRMSQELYDHYSQSDDPSMKNSRDLCSGNYASLFSVVNNSIRANLVGHSYNYWKISNASEADIQDDDITVIKIDSNGNESNISPGTVNGFEYIGHRTNQNTRYAPDVGEPATGLMIKLNGNARLDYPECIRAKTRTPTEFYGYIPLPREPDLATISVSINGTKYDQSSTNGWTYVGWSPSRNIKISHQGASDQPPVYKSGYFLELHGNAIFTNGDSIKIYYKPKI